MILTDIFAVPGFESKVDGALGSVVVAQFNTPLVVDPGNKFRIRELRVGYFISLSAGN